jgi:hypothetical protein
MDQINEFQRWVGAPVVGFVQVHWWWLLIIGFLVVATVFYNSNETGGPSVTTDVGGDPDGDGGGDGGD